MDLARGIIDAAVIGEGEFTAQELFAKWDKGDFESPTPGVCHRTEIGEVIEGPTRPMMDLKDLPPPDFGDFNLSSYTSKQLPFLISRGCVAKCNFCSETFFRKKYRVRTAESVFQEMKRNYEEYGITFFQSHDSLLNGSHKILEIIADKIIESGMKISWGGYCRVDKRLTPELLVKLKDSGFSFISFGLESGSQRVLDTMEKNTKVEHIVEVIPEAKKVGMNVVVGLIIGYPTERWIDYFKTLLVIFKLRKSLDMVGTGQTMSLPPNTKIRENLEFYNIEMGDHWDSWKTKDNKNTKEVRQLRLWMVRKFLTALRVNWA